MHSKRERGVVLVIVLAFILLLVIASTSYMVISLSEIRIARSQNDSTRAFYLAEAGVNQLIANESAGKPFADIGDPANNSGPTLGEGQYWVEIFPIANPIYAISKGVVNGKERKVKVELRDIPIPVNAINLFGSPTKHANLKIMEHNKKHQGEILVSGFDAGTGPDKQDKLAVGIENAETLNKIVDGLGKHLKKGGDLENTLVGDPANTFIDKDGNEFTASLGRVNPQGYDADFMEELSQQLADNARSMTPTQTIDLGGKEKDDELLDPDGDGMVNLGGLKSDVVYLTNGNLKLKKDLTVNGTGTLIIDGGKFDLHHATFNWDGDIYILGNEKKGDAKFHVHHADVDIKGDLFLLGSDNGKVKLHFHNNDKKHDGNTNIQGSILAFGGTGDKGKVELKAHHGDLNIEGFISMVGTKSKLDIHQQEPKDGNSDIRIDGGICVLVPEAKKEKKEKADIKLRVRGNDEGDFVIQYNSDVIEAAIQRLRNKLNLPLRVVSWQEL